MPKNKPTNAVQTRTIALRNPAQVDNSTENRTYEFVISSESPDTYGTVFMADGWDMTRYASNPVVTYNHRAGSEDPDDIIGTSRVYRDGNDWIGEVTLEQGNPKADKIKRKIDNGTMRGASIGALVHEGAYGDKQRNQDEGTLYFSRQELLEWSIVGINSNPDAVKRNQESINTAFAKAQTPQPQEQQRKTATLDEFEAAQLVNKYR